MSVVAIERVQTSGDLLPLPLLRWVAAGLVVLKVVMLFSSGAFMDETYYWMWGQHPALSYYDHPPLNAWLLGLSSLAFGWNMFALRLPVLIGLAADIAVIYLLARRLAPSAPGHFWVTLVLFLSTPMFHLLTAVALPDHVLILCVLVALHFFFGFFRQWNADGQTGYRDLYLGALALGLAGLAKYNAAFLGLALVAFIILTPRFRPLLLRWQLYAAALLTLALQLPVVVWNVSERFASYGFILMGRHAGVGASLGGAASFLYMAPLFLSPFLLVPLFRFAFGKSADPAESLARTIFWLSTLSIFAISFMTVTLFHWNLVAYCAALPFLAWHFRSRWLFAAHVIYGTVGLALAFTNYAIYPLADVQRAHDETSAWSFGWADTVAAVDALKAENGAGFVVAPDYMTASVLGFALKDKDITSLADKTDQYDFWFDPASRAGESAIVFADDFRGLNEVRQHFESLTPLTQLQVTRFGKRLDTHKLYLGTGYRP